MSVRGKLGFLPLGLLLAVIALVVDQATKWWIVFDIMRPPHVIPVFPFFNIVLGWNRGVSFGMFSSDSPFSQWLLIGLALAVVAVLLVWMKRAENRLVAVALGLIVGGAIGNVVDRIHFGAVVDFLDFFIGESHWPAFNLADTGITVGAVILVLDSWFARAELDDKDDNNDHKDADKIDK